MRHDGIAWRDVAVRLFPRSLVAVDFARRDIAIGLAARRAIAARTVARALARLAAALMVTFRAKLTVALTAAGTAARPTAIASVGEATLAGRSSALAAARTAGHAQTVCREG